MTSAAVVDPASSKEWVETERRLTVGVGVSTCFLASGALVVIAGLVVHVQLDTDAPLGLPVIVPTGAALMLVSAIPTGIFGAKLARHRRGRAALARHLYLSPGAIQVRF